MGLIAWIVLGGISGWIASNLYGDINQGIIRNVITGIVGALIGGLALNLIGGEGITGFNLYSIIVATGGSLVLLYLLHRKS